MINDFLALEQVFSEPETARKLEDVIRQYGEEHVKEAFKKGLLKMNKLACKDGHIYCWLSQKARRQSFRMSH